MKKIISALILVSLLTLPVMGLAIQEEEALPADVDLWTALDSVAKYLFGLLLIIAVIYLVLAAIQYVTAGGDPEKIKAAHQKVLYALIGIIVGVLAWTLITFVRSMVGAT